MAIPGLTKVRNVPRGSPAPTFTAPISVMAHVPGSPPVASRSRTQKVTSASGEPRSSKLAGAPPYACSKGRRWSERTFEADGASAGTIPARAVAPLPLHRLRQPHPLRRRLVPAAPGPSTTTRWAASCRSRTSRCSTRRSRRSPAAGAAPARAVEQVTEEASLKGTTATALLRPALEASIGGRSPGGAGDAGRAGSGVAAALPQLR